MGMSNLVEKMSVDDRVIDLKPKTPVPRTCTRECTLAHTHAHAHMLDRHVCKYTVHTARTCYKSHIWM
jgi:hypothetical protein